jgi:SAM-dependent methyltransferase
MSSYQDRVEAEIAVYAEQEVVHDLPEIYAVWAKGHVMPLLHEVGFDGFWDMYDQAVAEQCARRGSETVTMVSVGAGNGDAEVDLASRLAKMGHENLQLVLLELNPSMLERADALAREAGIADRVRTVQADLNTWCAEGPVDVYFANHSLHHVVELEHLFGQIKSSLDPDGVFLINDMIGRNGHQRWPEAVAMVNGIWDQMPERYRRNNYSGEIDTVYPDLDCSGESFEGVRAEDILPLLLKTFHPETYVTFANIVDPFVDRVYGPNFDINNESDVAFLEHIAQLDDAAMELRVLTPTHLVGSFRPSPVQCRYPRGRSPERTVHPASPPIPVTAPAEDPPPAEVHVAAEGSVQPEPAQPPATQTPYPQLLRASSVKFARRAAGAARRRIFTQR